MNQAEDRLQIAAAKLLDATGLIWCHVPNGGQRNLLVAVKLKKMGTKAGVPDILIFNPTDKHCGVAIELKVGKNKPTDTQREWMICLQACGWAVNVCRSIDEIIETLSDNYPKFKF